MHDAGFLNEEMKHTLFDIRINHLKKQKNPPSLRKAGLVIMQYEKLFCKGTLKEPSEEECRNFLKILSENDSTEIDRWLFQLLRSHSAEA